MASRTRPALGMAAALLLVLAAGCSPDEPERSSLSGQLTIWGGEYERAALDRVATRVAELSGVKLAVETFTFDVPGQLERAATAGELPDLVLGTPWYMSDLVERGLAVPVEIPGGIEFTGGALAAVRHDGQTYALPVCANGAALISNPKLVPQPPATVEELVDVGRRLVDTGAADQILATTTGPDAGPAKYLYPWFSAAGGYLYGTSDGGGYDTTDLGVDTPAGVRALGELGKLGTAGVLRTGTYPPQARQEFATGRVPFLVDDPWAMTEIGGLKGEARVTAVPGFAGGPPASPFLSVEGLYVLKSDGAELARSVLAELLVERDVLREFYGVELACAPAATHIDRTALLTAEQVAGFRAAGEHARPEPVREQWLPAATPFAEVLRAAVDGSDPRTAATDGARKIRQALTE